MEIVPAWPELVHARPASESNEPSDGPAGPCGPAGPWAPVAPSGPAGRAGPTAPAGPARPAGPAGPSWFHASGRSLDRQAEALATARSAPPSALRQAWMTPDPSGIPATAAPAITTRANAAATMIFERMLLLPSSGMRRWYRGGARESVTARNAARKRASGDSNIGRECR